MKYLALCLLAIMVAGCTDRFATDPGWDVRAAKQWAKSLGEENPKAICDHGDNFAHSYCNVFIGDKVYGINCHYDIGCML